MCIFPSFLYTPGGLTKSLAACLSREAHAGGKLRCCSAAGFGPAAGACSWRCAEMGLIQSDEQLHLKLNGACCNNKSSRNKLRDSRRETLRERRNGLS